MMFKSYLCPRLTQKREEERQRKAETERGGIKGRKKGKLKVSRDVSVYLCDTQKFDSLHIRMPIFMTPSLSVRG